MADAAEQPDESPLRFRPNRHQNIRVSHDGTLARRVDTNFFTRGLVLGARPVKVNERICFKLVEVTDNLGGFVYVGFTSRDPETQVGVTCQHLAKSKGFWSWFFPKELCTQNNLLFYCIGDGGVVNYGVDSTVKGSFAVGFKHNQPLWPLFDIFGNSSAIRLVQALPKSEPKQRKSLPLKLHPTHSPNIRVDDNVVQRLDAGFTQGYVFGCKPMKTDEALLIRIAPNHEGRFRGLVHLGVTSCDPATLDSADLPDNANSLVDRPEYWVLICDFTSLNCGDEIGLVLGAGDQISFRVNGGKFEGVVHVDATLKLWVFVGVYGSTQAVHLFSCPERVKDEEKECVVCYDNVIETALYKCGHMCMCFECAVEQWQGKGDGHCPLCRAVIRDVIKLNK